VILDRGEPSVGPWRVMSLVEFAPLVLDAIGPVVDRPRIVGVDGRTASGKTTLARRLAGMVASSAVVHTDDIAWWHSAAITVARDTSLLIGEGVGAGRRELAHLVAAVIWA
jgi:ABC-type cobalamin/Fe3+-siderophores transport system ATPase subunit